MIVRTTIGAGAPVVSATSAGNLPYLQGNWSGSGVYDRDPSARATFGIYNNAREFIFLQENY